jgi:hypothetical protein
MTPIFSAIVSLRLVPFAEVLPGKDAGFRDMALSFGITGLARFGDSGSWKFRMARHPTRRLEP